ncbi:MAG: DEAD/DEAH box helicase [Hyphomicrobium sp.]
MRVSNNERICVLQFNDLGLDTPLLKAITKEGYNTPTPIQMQVIPNVLQGRDILGIAQTGTGKTAAFALPILQKIGISNRQPLQRKEARALILCPTRELSTQIGESFRAYGSFIGLSVAVIYGGVSYKSQREKLSRGVDILVATPGRLLDLLKERTLTLHATEILVLDEADQMLDLGFIHSLRKIVSELPHQRQSLFFSATMPHEIGALAAELLKNPIKISINQETKVANDIEQKVIFVEQMQKRSLLVELFNNLNLQRAIVFTRTKRGADRVANFLDTAGINVAAIHGDKSQPQRNAAIEAFKNSKIRALIATDIAARGIDIDSVSHVINYEIPNVPEIYVHRIGRTARAGAMGTAISFVDHEEKTYLRDIERLTKQKISAVDRTQDPSLKQNFPSQKNTNAPTAFDKGTKIFNKKREGKRFLQDPPGNRKNHKKFKYRSSTPPSGNLETDSNKQHLRKSHQANGAPSRGEGVSESPTHAGPGRKNSYHGPKGKRRFGHQGNNRKRFSSR